MCRGTCCSLIYCHSHAKNACIAKTFFGDTQMWWALIKVKYYVWYLKTLCWFSSSVSTASFHVMASLKYSTKDCNLN